MASHLTLSISKKGDAYLKIHEGLSLIGESNRKADVLSSVTYCSQNPKTPALIVKFMELTKKPATLSPCLPALNSNNLAFEIFSWLQSIKAITSMRGLSKQNLEKSIFLFKYLKEPAHFNIDKRRN